MSQRPGDQSYIFGSPDPERPVGDLPDTVRRVEADRSPFGSPDVGSRWQTQSDRVGRWWVVRDVLLLERVIAAEDGISWQRLRPWAERVGPFDSRERADAYRMELGRVLTHDRLSGGMEAP